MIGKFLDGAVGAGVHRDDPRHPFANKLKLKSAEEVGYKRMIIEGILSLQAGDSPTQIEARLMVFIPQTVRDAIKSSNG